MRVEADGRTVERPKPIGYLERKTEEGRWEPVWVRSLMNPVSPVTALVADNGSHVVTFDNWHSIGRGENVIVIYGPEGKLIRSLTLTDVVPENYVAGLSHSVSSTYWKSGAAILVEEKILEIDLLVPVHPRKRDKQEAVTFRIALEDGTITFPPTDEWEAALCAANNAEKERERIEQERIAYLRDPLVAPAGCEMRDWHQYLREAHLRLAPDYLDDPVTSTTVLFPSDHKRYEESVGWLRDRMTEESGYPRAASFVAPCDPDGLLAAIRSIMRDVEPGTLSEATFYISSPEAQYAEIERLIIPSGATLVWLDPAKTIPQRPERVPGSAEEKAANEERLKRMQADIDLMMEDF